MLRRWHLFSLDAPTVAVLWTWFVAHSLKTRVDLYVLIAMLLAVWVIYAGDRLLDSARLRQERGGDLKERHHFHRQHQKSFLVGILCAVIVLAVLVTKLSPSIRISYVVLAFFMGAYLFLVHVKEAKIPKEFFVGLIFSTATFVPAIDGLQVLSLTLILHLLLFALVLWLDCLFIEMWERKPNTPKAASPFWALLGIVLVFGAIAKFACPVWPLDVACALSATLLLLLNFAQANMTVQDLRIYADLALLTPLFLLL